MINVQNLSYSFPNKELYKDISFTLEEGQHCAFIGTSGSGKSTLANIIMNPENYMYDGLLEMDPGHRTGYVSQFSNLDSTDEATVFEYIAKDFIALEKEILVLCNLMETATELETLLNQYQEALDAFAALDGDNYESNIEKQLNLAGLLKHRNLPINKLSGGEFKLVQVIKELLSLPDLMIMDEPDVFLDFENLSALKELINGHNGIILIITHNRYLLNHCFNKIIHLEDMALQEFEGGYVAYNYSLLLKKIELQELSIKDDEEIERNQKIIDKLRFIATHDAEAARGKSLHARVKIHERLLASRIKAPFVDIKQPKISFTTSQNPHLSTPLELTDYTVSFDTLLLENVSFSLKATDKVALIGPNGSGKTTLLRQIMIGGLETIHIEDGVLVGYLSQEQKEVLTESNTIMDEFLDAGFPTYDSVRSYLSEFGIDDLLIDQKISALSGGEKNLLQLAKLTAGKADLLLLDEPTSHLDTYAQLALEEALQNYQGAVLMISHDFYTIANAMDYVLLIDDKTIRKVSMRKFRKMIYSNHFDHEYLELEQKKKALESKVQLALKDKDFETAQNHAATLEPLIDSMIVKIAQK